MRSKTRTVTILGMVLLATMGGCETFKKAQLEKEVKLVIKAGKGNLSPDEKEDLRKSNDPLLIQLSDPNTSKLLSLFADLPGTSVKELLRTGYLKWAFSSLDPQRQEVWRDLIQVNIDMAVKQGAKPNPSFSQQALELASVGFAVIDIPELRTKVISWYVLWPEGQPTWVTVVGARAAGSQPYFSAHLIQLPILKEKPGSLLPK